MPSNSSRRPPCGGRSACWCRPARPCRVTGGSRGRGNRPAVRGRARIFRSRPASSGPPAPAGRAACACSPAGCTSASRSARPTNARCTIVQPGADGVDRLADPQAEVSRNLVVAAAAGVQLAAHVADPVDQSPLDVHVDVFQLLRNSNSPAAISWPICSRPVTIWWHSSSVRMPTLESMWAWAIEPRMSWAYSRRSKLTLSVNFSTRRSVARSKTPLQGLLANVCFQPRRRQIRQSRQCKKIKQHLYAKHVTTNCQRAESMLSLINRQ